MAQLTIQGSDTWQGVADDLNAMFDDIYPLVTNRVSVDHYGAVGDGVTDDQPAIQSALDALTEGQQLYFTPGKTYLLGDRLFRGTGISFSVWAYGATIKMDDYSHLEVFKIVYSTSDPDDYIDNEFNWFGGTIDVNGYNQQFAWAEYLRDGTGTPSTTYNTTRGQAMAAATADIWGDIINPLSTNSVGSGADAVYIIGYERVRVRDLKFKNRVENGCTAFNCAVAVYENCSDYDAIATNDQFVISFVNGGNSSTGHQHFAWAGSQARSWGIIQLSSGQSANFSVSDTVVGATSGATSEVYRIDATNDVLYVENVKVNRYVPGEDLEVSSVVEGACTWFNLKARGRTYVINCDSEQGNTAAGYVGVFNDAIGSGLLVQGGVAINQGTASYRCEGGEWAVIKPAVTENTGGIRADPTKTLNYASMQAFNCNNDMRFVQIEIGMCRNMRIHGEDGIDAEHMVVANTQFTFDDYNPILDYLDVPNQIQVVAGPGWTMQNCKVKSVMSDAGDYIVSEVMNNQGIIRGLEFENVQWVGDSVRIMDGVKGTKCARIANGIVANTTQSPNFRNIDVDTVDEFAFAIRGSSGTVLPHVFDGLNIRNVQENVFRCGDPTAREIIVKNSIFKDCGLSGTATNQERAVIGGDTGCELQSIRLYNNIFERTTASAHNSKYHCDNEVLEVHDYGSQQIDSEGDGWGFTKGSSTAIKWLLENGGFTSVTIASGVLTLEKYSPFILVGGEGGAADDLVTLTMNNPDHGYQVVVQPSNPSHTITLKHGTGNLDLQGADVVLSSRHCATLVYRSSVWYLVSTTA